MQKVLGTRMKRNSENSSQENKIDQVNSLRPFTYTNILRQDAVVGVNNIVSLELHLYLPLIQILSPKAFATTLLSPKFMLVSISISFKLIHVLI